MGKGCLNKADACLRVVCVRVEGGGRGDGVPTGGGGREARLRLSISTRSPRRVCSRTGAAPTRHPVLNAEGRVLDAVGAVATAMATTGGAGVMVVGDKESHGTLLTAKANVFSKEMKVI